MKILDGKPIKSCDECKFPSKQINAARWIGNKRKEGMMDFDFNVKGNTGYMELTFTAENVHASSGLLDEVESVELAAKLIYAAEELLSAGFGESEHKLREIRESLESG